MDEGLSWLKSEETSGFVCIAKNTLHSPSAQARMALYIHQRLVAREDLKVRSTTEDIRRWHAECNTSSLPFQLPAIPDQLALAAHGCRDHGQCCLHGLGKILVHRVQSWLITLYKSGSLSLKPLFDAIILFSTIKRRVTRAVGCTRGVRRSCHPAVRLSSLTP